MLGGVRTLLLTQETPLFGLSGTATVSVGAMTLTLGIPPVLLSGSYTPIITASGSYAPIISKSGRAG